MKKNFFLIETEWRFVIHSLNTLKTKLHNGGHYIDTVDDALLKVKNSRVKRVKVTC